MHTLIYLPYIFFISYALFELASRMAWLHTPHFTTVKTAFLTAGTLSNLITLIFGYALTPDGTTFSLDATYELVAWVTFTFFAVLTLVYLFEWIKDHRISLAIERSYFRRGYEYAEAHARWLVGSPLMIFAAIAGAILLASNIYLLFYIFGIY